METSPAQSSHFSLMRPFSFYIPTDKEMATESNKTWASAFSMVQHVKPAAYIIMIILFLFTGYVSNADLPILDKTLSLLLSFVITLTLTVSEYMRIEEEEWKRKHGE